MPPNQRLLIVCLGNICRSPMAEGVLRARLRDAGLEAAVMVDSCGTGGWHAGAAPDPRAIACAARNGVDIAGLRARQLSPADFEGFDAVLCADRRTLRHVLAMAPERMRAGCMLLSTFAGRGEVEIPDPYTGDAQDFDHAWALADGMAEAIVRRLSA